MRDVAREYSRPHPHEVYARGAPLLMRDTTTSSNSHVFNKLFGNKLYDACLDVIAY